MDHELFKREGNNVYLKVQINAIDAALGCKITVPTVQGDVDMEINEGTQYGQKYRLRGKGIKDLRTKIYGDQYVIIEVITPTNLTKEEKELLAKVRDVEDTKPPRQSFWSKIKSNMKK